MTWKSVHSGTNVATITPRTFTQLKEDLRLKAGALPATHKTWTNSSSGSLYINQGQDFLVLRALRGDRENLGLFPELEDRWHEKTSNGVSYIDIPERILAIDSVWSYDETGAEPGEASAYRRKLAESSGDEYESFGRESSGADFPRTWSRIENRLYFTPTPDAASVTWVMIKGLKVCPYLSDPGDTSILKEWWMPALLEAAAYLLYRDLGWNQEAEESLAALDRAITQVVSIKALERRRKFRKLRIKGAPWSV